LEVEPQAEGRIALRIDVGRQPRIRLNEVRERDFHLDWFVLEPLQHISRDWQFVLVALVEFTIALHPRNRREAARKRRSAVRGSTLTDWFSVVIVFLGENRE
jgi:hypothetical protein